MALHHAQPGVPVTVQPFGASLQGQKTSALFKSETLEVIRLVLMAGKRLPVHQVPGEMTLQCLEGQLTLSQNGNHQTLSAGQLLFLPAQTPHEVEAVQDSSALITIVLQGHGR